MKTRRVITVGICAIALIALAAVLYRTVIFQIFSLPPVSDAERSEIQNVLGSDGLVLGTNILSVERLSLNSMRVTTRTSSGAGGDTLDFEFKHGQWVIAKRGVWMH
jgi:hypothetical protein